MTIVFEPRRPEVIREELRSDLDAAIDRLDAAMAPDELRRALREALSTLYVWREFEKKSRGIPKGFAGHSAAGDDLELVIQWRNIDAHEIALLINLEVHHLVSSEYLVPSDNLIIGHQPHFKILADEELDLLPQRIRGFYPRINGQPVTLMLREARDFLSRLGNAEQPPTTS